MPAVPNSRLLQDRFPSQFTQNQIAVSKPIVLLSLELQAIFCVPSPCCSFQHMQNCLPSVSWHVHSVTCLQQGLQLSIVGSVLEAQAGLSGLTWIGGRLFLWANTELWNHQSYNGQRLLSRPKCSCMWAWPLAFQAKLFRTIQSQAVS